MTEQHQPSTDERDLAKAQMEDETATIEPAGADSDATAAPNPMTWVIEDFDPANPFTAGLVIAADDIHAWVDLAPMTVNALHDALGTIRAAQRAAILGEDIPTTLVAASPDANDAAATPQPADTDPTDEAAKDRRRARAILTALIAIVAASIVYGLAAGAVLI